MRKNNARINEKSEKAKEAKNYTHLCKALGELKCAYTKKK